MKLIIKRGMFGSLHYYIDDGLTLHKISRELGEKLCLAKRKPPEPPAPKPPEPKYF